MIKYFAYGSNMDKDDLDKWCKKKGLPKVQLLSNAPAKLPGYKLSFNYYSTSRKAGSANIMRSSGNCVYGLLIELEVEDLSIIRKKEGYPNYYDEINVDLEKFDGTIIQGVITYKVVENREKLSYQHPTKYYLSLIIKNAEMYNFPYEYVEFLKSLATID